MSPHYIDRLNQAYAIRDNARDAGDEEAAAAAQLNIDALLRHPFAVEPVMRGRLGGMTRSGRGSRVMYRVTCSCSDGWLRVVSDEDQAVRLGVLHAYYASTRTGVAK